VKELKEILQHKNIGYSDCIEKSDLVKKVVDTEHLEPKTPTIRKSTRNISGLACRIVQNSQQHDYIVVISHGFGADYDDLAPFASSALQQSAVNAKKFMFVFPNAPLALSQGGYGWWNIDINALLTRAMSGQVDQIMAETPQGLPEARKALMDVLTQLKLENPTVPWSKFILGGFSQGAIMSVDVAFHLDETVGAVVGWSGALMCKGEWEKLAPSKSSLYVVLSHGSQDQVLPFLLGKSLEQFLKSHKISVDFLTFTGGHQIPQNALQKFISLLENIQ